MSNRVSSQGKPPLTALGRSSLRVANIIPANGTLQLPAAGTFFYITACSAPFKIKPSGGNEAFYETGTGLRLPEINAFANLQLINPTGVAIAFEIFYGFDEFVDNRVIIAQSGQTQVAYPTYPTPSSAAVVNINDISGAKFADVNGNNWYALSREGIYVFNPTASGTDLLLQKAGSNVSNGPAVGIIYAGTTLRFSVAGNYCLSVGGGNINAIVSEIYFAVPATQ